jgi:8-oxo-dGTP pyrophosphatase MutT (NUDIX family)
MKATNLCFLVRESEVLLAMKKRGFGVGKWNGVGGKVKEGEDVREAAVREIEEEIGVVVAISDLEDFGTLRFSFENNPSWDNETRLFIARKWTNDPIESEEMRPQWYPMNELPFGEMWVDDPNWLPKILAGKKVEGDFLFTKDGAAMISFDVRETA